MTDPDSRSFLANQPQPLTNRLPVPPGLLQTLLAEPPAASEPAPLPQLRPPPLELVADFTKKPLRPMRWYDRVVFPGTWNTSCEVLGCPVVVPRHRKTCLTHGHTLAI